MLLNKYLYNLSKFLITAAIGLCFYSCGKIETVPSAGSIIITTTEAASSVTTEEVSIQTDKQTSTVAATETTVATTTEKKSLDKIPLSFYEIELKVGESRMPIVEDDIKEIWTSSDNSIATVNELGNITAVSEGDCIITVSSSDDNDYKAEIKVTVVKQTGLTYIDGILIANKTYSLPSDYNPGGLTPETNDAFDKLVQGAANDGINIYLSSGFRSYSLQSQIYNQYCADYGQAQADTFSARPGYSEHQTGMAIDVNIIDDSFAGTPEAIWIENHCFEYGFILRYPKGKDNITGYKYEPWHIRYIGIDKAKAVHDSGLTLEEYLGITSEYSE